MDRFRSAYVSSPVRGCACIGVLVLCQAVWLSACSTGAGDADAGASYGQGSDEASITSDGGGTLPSTIVRANDASGADDSAADVTVLGDVTGTRPCEGVPSGQACGPAPDSCHDAPQCQGGVCVPAQALPDGTMCAPAPDACHTYARCSGGTCGS